MKAKNLALLWLVSLVLVGGLAYWVGHKQVVAVGREPTPTGFTIIGSLTARQRDHLRSHPAKIDRGWTVTLETPDEGPQHFVGKALPPDFKVPEGGSGSTGLIHPIAGESGSGDNCSRMLLLDGRSRGHALWVLELTTPSACAI